MTQLTLGLLQYQQVKCITNQWFWAHSSFFHNIILFWVSDCLWKYELWLNVKHEEKREKSEQGEAKILPIPSRSRRSRLEGEDMEREEADACWGFTCEAINGCINTRLSTYTCNKRPLFICSQKCSSSTILKPPTSYGLFCPFINSYLHSTQEQLSTAC